MGKDVAAIDADVWGFSMPRMLGVENGPELIDENLMIPPSGHGVRLLSMGFFVPEDQAGDLAGADAAQGARAVPQRRRLGRARLPRWSTCPRAPGTSRCA